MLPCGSDSFSAVITARDGVAPPGVVVDKSDKSGSPHEATKPADGERPSTPTNQSRRMSNDSRASRSVRKRGASVESTNTNMTSMTNATSMSRAGTGSSADQTIEMEVLRLQREVEKNHKQFLRKSVHENALTG